MYAMLSFLAVVVLCKIYTGIYRERKQAMENLEGQGELPHPEQQEGGER